MLIAGLYVAPATVEYSTIVDGEVFQSGSAVYIKVVNGGAINAVNINSGDGATAFNAADPVVKLTGNITVRAL